MDHDGAYLTQLNSSHCWSLVKEKEFTIGRSLNNSIVLSSQFISRQQCLIKYESSCWTIYDLSSTNSTRVNGAQINEKSVIKDGDIIEFSVPYAGNAECKKYKFSTSIEPPAKRVKLSSDNCYSDSKNDSMLNNESDLDVILRLGSLEIELAVANKRNDENIMVIEDLKREIANLSDINARLVNDISFLRGQHDDDKDKVSQLNQQVSNLTEELLLAKRDVICERSEVNNFKVNLQELKEQLEDAESEIDTLVSCSSKSLCTIQVNLQQQPISNLEVDSLKNDLSLVTEKFHETSKMLVLSVNEIDQIRNSVKGVVDSDLLCSVCQDTLFKATTLSCRHTFCDFCIQEWTKRKLDCPVCRAPITTKSNTILIDTVIDNLVALLDEESKEKRRVAKLERNMPAVPAMTTSRGGRGSRRRGGRSGYRGGLSRSISDMVEVLRDRFMVYQQGRNTPNHVQVIGPIDLTVDTSQSAWEVISDLESLSDISVSSSLTSMMSSSDEDNELEDYEIPDTVGTRARTMRARNIASNSDQSRSNRRTRNGSGRIGRSRSSTATSGQTRSNAGNNGQRRQTNRRRSPR